MPAMRRVAQFQNTYPLAGPSLWLISLQYFVVQLVVALAWQPAYSVRNNTISDLGNTVCNLYGGRAVCSPLHELMNASFIVLGLTMLAGAGLIYQEYRASLANRLGFSAMALAGLGTVLVGVFPENTIGSLHFIGALLPFLIGNAGMLVLGLSLPLPCWLKLYSIGAGIVSLTALGLFVTHHYLGLGIGGMERVVAHPQTVWLILFGAYMTRGYMAGGRKSVAQHR